MSLLPEYILKEIITEDFSSLPRIAQIDSFLKHLYETGHSKITAQEICQLFKDANMTSPQRNKKIRCGAFKVKEYLDIIANKNNSQSFSILLTKIPKDKYKIILK
jgi:hypothetical protein